MANKGLISVLKEGKEYGNMFLDGDFDSDASEQSWSQFWKIFTRFGAPIAIASELSTWHGEIKFKQYDHPYTVIVGGKIPIPENYKISFIKSGTKSSDLVNGVLTDEKGEYISYPSQDQKLNFYLPNSVWFNNYLNVPYKFETETGDIFTLVLSLSSNKSNLGLQTGSDMSEDNMQTSLSNSKPDNGNGWGILPPPDNSNQNFCYYNKVGQNFLPYNVTVLNDSIKSSYQLFWEKWGILIQIVGSVILATFTAGMSAYIEGIFIALSANALELGLMAEVVVWNSISTWLAAAGSGFAVSRVTLISMVVLESAINLPAAYIDNMFNNNFGATLGIAFCFFPLVSTYGKIGRFVTGKFSQEAVNSILNKIVVEGLSETTSATQLFKFVTQTLNAEEQLMFSQAMKLLTKEEGKEALKSSIEEAVKNGVKMKSFPTKIKRWWAASEGGKILRTFIVAGVYFIDVSKFYLGIESLRNKVNDPRTSEKIFEDSQKNLDNIKNKFINSDKNNKFITTSSEKIVQDIINSSEKDVSTNIVYELSKPENEGYFLNLIALKKLEEYEKLTSDQTKASQTESDIKEILDMVSEINNLLTTPKKTEEINSFYDAEDSKETILNALADYSTEYMSSEINIAAEKNECLLSKKKFKYVDGYYFTNGWVLIYEVLKKVKIKHELQYMILDENSKLYLYNNNNFSYKDIEYKNFSCT